MEFNIVNNIDAILETKYCLEEEEIEDSNENQDEQCHLNRIVGGNFRELTPKVEPVIAGNLYHKYSVVYDIYLDVPANSTIKDVEVKLSDKIYSPGINIKSTSSGVSYSGSGHYIYSAEFEIYNYETKIAIPVKKASSIFPVVRFIVNYKYCY